MAPISTVAASQEYHDLMQPILSRAIDQGPRKVVSQCPQSGPRHESSPFDRSFFDFLVASYGLPKRLWKSITERQVIELAPLHPSAQLIQDQMLALLPFADMSREKRSQSTVDIVIPSWLIGTEEACHAATAAERTFGRVVRLESAPSSAYTAAGYELCRISYEAFDCTGPGAIMTLEFDGNLAVASLVRTPLLAWSASPVTFSATQSTSVEGLTEWIDTFVDAQKPDKVILVDPKAKDFVFADLVAKSRAAPMLEEEHHLPSGHIQALGAAQAAKDRLESQIDDCGESAECEDLRRKADSLAGSCSLPRPSTWPAIGLRHLEL